MVGIVTAAAGYLLIYLSTDCEMLGKDPTQHPVQVAVSVLLNIECILVLNGSSSTVVFSVEQNGSPSTVVISLEQNSSPSTVVFSLVLSKTAHLLL